MSKMQAAVRGSPKGFFLTILPASCLQAQHLEGWPFWGAMEVSIGILCAS